MDLHWTKVEERPIEYGGFRKIVRRIFRLPDGSTAPFDVKEEAGNVCVFALTTDHHVVLATQFRPGPEEVLHELPGGGIEPGETAKAAAARELLEETGYAGRMLHVTRCLDCGYSTLRREVFVALECAKVAEQQPDAHEFISVTLMTLPEFRAHLRSGKLTDIEVGYLALDYLRLLA